MQHSDPADRVSTNPHVPSFPSRGVITPRWTRSEERATRPRSEGPGTERDLPQEAAGVHGK